MNIKLKISTFDSFNEKTENIFNGTKTINNGIIKYTYNDEFGVNKIFLKNDSIKIFRKGKINSKLILELNKHTQFSYSSSYINKIFKISTKKIETLEKDIKLVYSIYDDSELVNNITIHIKEL
ncbi:uncharacterized beta-barrel protein YwiB (DUF1934 family) [Hypnocyclicus thermotrophus]|uniref:Uncharacterized beta-barrel protein YwiB (DUF1934 family) n=1 Tax=Hypnocyclicus thermotrophus TaxID=1627895 RepID=A0AA46I697_9FUSO|nr:DUF1934 family protein [Hypnocyclicus thermotrophus]TDT71925.1 uncharacterized beta-barrel protein YwiB (DUF1934 family) [Hypnocyclicus thermotrophus]